MSEFRNHTVSRREPGTVTADGRAMDAHQRAMQTTLARIAKVERRIAHLYAEQVELVASFVDDRLAFDDAHGFLSGTAQHRGMLAEVAIAKRVSVTSAATFMDDAWTLAHQNVATMNALRAGRIALPAARAICRETSLLEDPSARALADQVIAEEAPDVLPGKVRALAEQRVAEVDPEAALRRTLRERQDRHVRLEPAGPGMAWLSAYLPAEQATAAFDSVHDEAVRRQGDDPRSLRHLMCDALVERLTGLAADQPIPAQVTVTMTDQALLGLSDDPALLQRTGPLPAAIARDLSTSSAAWLRRFLTDPVDGSLTRGDPRRRRFDGSLRDAIIARDQHCRGIQCNGRIVDIDHIHEHARGGTTDEVNGHGLTEGCHIIREDPRVRVRRDPTTGVIDWTTPSGLTWRSLPPAAPARGLLQPWQHFLRRQLLHPSDSRMENYLVEYAVTDLRHRVPRC